MWTENTEGCESVHLNLITKTLVLSHSKLITVIRRVQHHKNASAHVWDHFKIMRSICAKKFSLKSCHHQKLSPSDKPDTFHTHARNCIGAHVFTSKQPTFKIKNNELERTRNASQIKLWKVTPQENPMFSTGSINCDWELYSLMMPF